MSCSLLSLRTSRLVVLCAALAMTTYTGEASADPIITIQLPDQWGIVDPTRWDPGILWMAAGPSEGTFIPTLNCAYDQTSRSLESYVEAARRECADPSWRKIGTLETAAGPAMLICFDADGAHGRMKLLQLMAVRDGIAAVVTASCSATQMQEVARRLRPVFQSLRIFDSETAALGQVGWSTLSDREALWGAEGPCLAKPEDLPTPLTHYEWAITVAQVARRVAANRLAALNRSESQSCQMTPVLDVLEGAIDGDEEALLNEP
ncbi:MAG: hypothetical protein ACOYKZ_06840 [Chlamydiia bacterium]